MGKGKSLNGTSSMTNGTDREINGKPRAISAVNWDNRKEDKRSTLIKH